MIHALWQTYYFIYIRRVIKNVIIDNNENIKIKHE